VTAPPIARPALADHTDVPAVRSSAVRSPADAGRAPVVWPARLLVAALVGGAVLATAGTLAWTAGDAALERADPDLTRLMQAMALLKGGIVAMAVAALGWRLQRPTPAAFTAGYLTLVWLMSAMVALMWRMEALGTVAVLLHAAGAALVVLAWRDREFMPGVANGDALRTRR
jgi:hypothetical protein